MLEIRSDQIDLWLAFSHQIKDPALLNQYRQLLTAEEKQQEQRFHFDKDKHRYLVTRALVRTVLSQYVAMAPENWVFSPNAYGKPAISNQHPEAMSISFNISHTDGLIVLGITKNSALGLDTENIISRPAPLDVAKQFFSESEVAQLHSLDYANRHERFYQYWTLKEAYIKARGMGLSIPLNQFSFHLPTEPNNFLADFSFHPDLKDDRSRWQFWQMKASDVHLLAACAERSDADRRLNVNRVVPLVEQERQECTPVFNFSNA